MFNVKVLGLKNTKQFHRQSDAHDNFHERRNNIMQMASKQMQMKYFDAN